MKNIAIFNLIALSFLVSCSKEIPKEVQVKISFAKSPYASKNVRAKAPGRRRAKNCGGGPMKDPAPTTVDGIDCLGIFINDRSSNGGSCDLLDSEESGSTTTNPPNIIGTVNSNIFSGFFHKSASKTQTVAVADNVEFYIIGFSSSDGTCLATVDEMDTNTTITFSDPQLIGKHVQNITPNTTEITITTDFANSSFVGKCNSMPGIPDDGQGSDTCSGPSPDPRCDPTSNPNATSTTVFADGDGSVATPYLICQVDQLQLMESDLTANYELGNEIHAGGYPFIPIATCTAPSSCGVYFSGTLNGHWYPIFDLVINRTGTDQHWNGLFGQLASTANIQQLSVVNATINSGMNHHNGVIAGLSDGATIQDVLVTAASPNGGMNIGDTSGGVVGEMLGGTLNKVRAVVDIMPSSTYQSQVGGVVGSIYNSTSNVFLNEVGVSGTINSGNSGSITPTGGLIGILTLGSAGPFNVNINNTYNHAHVSGSNYIGGLVGQTVNNGSGTLTISNSFNSGPVNDTAGGGTGGLIGYHNSSNTTITNSFNTASVDSPTSAAASGWLIGNQVANLTSVTSLYAIDIGAGDTATACSGTAGAGTGMSCTAETDMTAFYISTHAVYSTWDTVNTWWFDPNYLPHLQNIAQPPSPPPLRR